MVGVGVQGSAGVGAGGKKANGRAADVQCSNSGNDAKNVYRQVDTLTSGQTGEQAKRHRTTRAKAVVRGFGCLGQQGKGKHALWGRIQRAKAQEGRKVTWFGDSLALKGNFGGALQLTRYLSRCPILSPGTECDSILLDIGSRSSVLFTPPSVLMPLCQALGFYTLLQCLRKLWVDLFSIRYIHVCRYIM